LLFIDEIHRLSPVVEEYLYSAMEDYRIDLVIDATRLRDRMRLADLCLTGEGRIDHSSGYGKTVAGVARVARELGKPCVAMGGSVASGADAVLDQGITAFFSILTEPMNLSHALDPESTRRRLGRTAEQVCRLWYGANPSIARPGSDGPPVAESFGIPG